MMKMNLKKIKRRKIKRRRKKEEEKKEIQSFSLFTPRHFSLSYCLNINVMKLRCRKLKLNS